MLSKSSRRRGICIVAVFDVGLVQILLMITAAKILSDRSPLSTRIRGCDAFIHSDRTVNASNQNHRRLRHCAAESSRTMTSLNFIRESQPPSSHFLQHKRRTASSLARLCGGCSSVSNDWDGGIVRNNNHAPIRHEATRLYSTAAEQKNENTKSPSQLEIEAASESRYISGNYKSSSLLQNFGGIPYRNTSLRATDGEDINTEPFRVVFVLGGPGAGKGTQCEYLLDNYPCVHLSAGQLLREEAEKVDTSPHAALISECLVEGKIVPVEISLTLLQNAMKEADGKSIIFLIDGFPRNFDNLEGWTRCMTGVADVWGVLYYQCPLSILEGRVMERSKESGRSDDNLQSLRRRFGTFEGETVPVIDTLRRIEEDYDSLLKVVDVAGEQSREQVFEDSQQAMNEFLKNDVLSVNARLLDAISTNDMDLYKSLCADEIFELPSNSKTPGSSSLSSRKQVGPTADRILQVMRTQEGKEGEFTSTSVKCAELTFITGTQATVSYDRTSTSGHTFRETRIWSHQGSKGWRMVHFFRTPKC